MGIPFQGRAGGPPTHLPCLVDYFEHHPGFSIRTFGYGAATDAPESTLHRILHTLRTWFGFILLLISYRPDIVHLNTAFDPKTVLRDVPFSLTCFFFRKRLLLKFHGSLSGMISVKNPAWRLLNRTLFLGAARIGVLSEPERQEFIRSFGLASKFIVVRNIVNMDTGSATTAVPFKKVPGTVAGLFAARIIRDKGLQDLLRAMPGIIEKEPEFRLVVAGDGPDLENSRQLAQELGVNQAIHWLGHVEHKALAAVFPETDFLIFPSRFPEGMPMTILDSMKYGLPLITTPVRFAQEHFTEPANCLFISSDDSNSIISAVCRIINDHELRKSMIHDNHELIKEFSAEKVGADFAGIYHQMLVN